MQDGAEQMQSQVQDIESHEPERAPQAREGAGVSNSNKMPRRLMTGIRALMPPAS